MNYYNSLLLLTLTLGITFFVLYFFYSLWQKKKLERISQIPFKEEYKEILKKLYFYTQLQTQEKETIHKHILIFINTKEFIGVDIDVTDEMKIIIAFHACLVVLHVDIDGCYDNLSSVVIYSHTIVANQISENGGIYTKGEFLLEGQSASDTVVISWNDAKKDAYHIHNDNVIIHEFAHEIDFLDGIADGTPPLPSAKYHEWAKVLSQVFNQLQKVTLENRDWGKYKLIGAYAATNEAEFFAVVTERYFENPQGLKKHFPALFKELNLFYKIYSTNI